VGPGREHVFEALENRCGDRPSNPAAVDGEDLPTGFSGRKRGAERQRAGDHASNVALVPIQRKPPDLADGVLA